MSGGDSCPVKYIEVYVQSNGIIRLVDTGVIVGRLTDNVSYEDLEGK